MSQINIKEESRQKFIRLFNHEPSPAHHIITSIPISFVISYVIEKIKLT